MKKYFYFILSMLLSGALTFGCSKAFAAWKGADDGQGGCYYLRYTYVGTGTNSQTSKVLTGTNAYGLPSPVSNGTYSNQPYIAYYVSGYHWDGNEWTNTYNGSSQYVTSADYATNQAVLSEWCDHTTLSENSLNPVNVYPDGPPAGCTEPSVNCEELEGETFTASFGGKYPTGPFCSDDCEVVPSGGFSMYDPTLNVTTYVMEITGEDADPSCADPEDIPSCNAAEDDCLEVCRGITMNFSCDEETGLFSCGCEYPEYNLIKDDGEVKSDSDKDDIPNNEDSDIDNDGTDNETDPDVDGDGRNNGADGDVDDDGLDNRGNETWTQGSSTWGSNTNGVGADPDVDGDGYENGSDPDIDGDGIPNGSDSDIDGDGIPNSSDLDVDGDGVLNGSDSDADGDGITNDDLDPTGSGNVDGDTDGDGDVDGDDEPDGDGEAPGDLEGGGVCPEGQVCIGDGVCQSGEDQTSADCVGANYLQTRWGELQDTIMGTGLGTLINLGDLPSSSDSQININLGTWGGETSFDLTTLNFAWAILNGLFTLMFLWLGIKIILLKHG